MSHANETSNFNLPIFSGSDKPKMQDVNTAYLNIDTGLNTSAASLADSEDRSHVIHNAIQALTSQIQAAKGNVTQQQTKANATDALIDDIVVANTTSANDIEDIDDANDDNMQGVIDLNSDFNDKIKFKFGIVNGEYGYYTDNNTNFVAFV